MRGILDNAYCEVDGHDFDTMVPVLRSRLLLGQQVGDPIAEDKIDRRVMFLKKAWRPTLCWARSTLYLLPPSRYLSLYYFVLFG